MASGLRGGGGYDIWVVLRAGGAAAVAFYAKAGSILKAGGAAGKVALLGGVAAGGAGLAATTNTPQSVEAVPPKAYQNLQTSRGA